MRLTPRAVTADQSSVLSGTTGGKQTAWATPYSAPAGTYFVALVLNGTWDVNTLTLKATGAGVTVNAGLSAPNLRYSNLLTGQTSLPLSVTLNNQVTTQVAGGSCSQWYGVS